MVAQDAVRFETNRPKPPAEEALLQGEDLAMQRLKYELNKSVERLRSAAEMYNLPFDFAVKRESRKRIKARDRRTGTERELTLEEAEDWLEELNNSRGENLHGYV